MASRIVKKKGWSKGGEGRGPKKGEFTEEGEMDRFAITVT